MLSSLGRIPVLAAGALLTFGLAALILLKALPGPHRDVDYMVVGALATFASMGVLFAVLSKTAFKGRELFFKRRDGSKNE